MRRCGILVAVGLALTGCKYLDRARNDDRPPPALDRTQPASSRRDRDKDRDRDNPPTASIPPPDTHWLDGPASRSGRVDLPPSPAGRSGSNTGGRNTAGQGQGTLAGYVVDDYGKKVRGVFVEVTPADRTGPGASTGVETGDDGSFQIGGLDIGQTYILSAKATREGVELAGQVYTTPPNARLQIPLKEGMSLPPSSSRGGSAPQAEDLGTLRRPNSRRPSPVPLSDDRNPSPPSADSTRPDGSWSPSGPALPPPPRQDAAPARNPGRPELTTEGDQPGFRLPATNIPPPERDKPPTIIPPPADPDPGRSESRSIRPRSEFVLIDTLGRMKDFPTGRAGELVLLEFMTTHCVPCKKAVPAMKDLQARYAARGLDVIGVACDEVDTPQRRAVAGSYQRTHDLNYLLYVEPGDRPGRVRDRFGVEFYPSMVLLNSAGDVLWKGDPRDLGPLERIIEENLGK